MNLLQLKSLFIDELTDTYPKEEILSFYYLLIEGLLHLQKKEVFLEPTIELSTQQLSEFKNSIALLKQEKPIQYILGSTEFCGFTFKVNKNVLIPRPETEELVSWICSDRISDISNQKDTDSSKTSILDIGTGSGCIAISLAKKYRNANVSALDVSKNALSTAKENAIANDVAIHFIEQDILNLPLRLNTTVFKKYDIIVSNPPYVRELEKQEMQNNVLQNEPHLALFVANDNPLLFYDKIAEFAKENLTENGLLYFEINQYLASETAILLKQKGFNRIEIREDIYGNKRMLKATNKSNL
ncbi:peptide chain release factor N(5)-glutamine methyltransferase [Aureibaculum sp. A20]|uniref:peptide chain release factor N(5)-glutamine methyltransferase n=1 Tax=Aureibaculum flavum TaxID=2795986 RepID=A0ABS0WTN8_9FLAO|nr:peptide chain release factor N(5)-glutamine methyltransferase [Aureibaculum flavum]MBJ2175333.1 peptide chain release factor N(5)-glutamine methyltransferase [Aureibaculum flavum]